MVQYNEFELKPRQPRPSLDLLKNKKNLVGIEIGVQTGANAKWMLENLDIEKLYLIDPYTEYRCNNNKPIDKGGLHPATPEFKKTCLKVLASWEEKIEYIYKFSWDAIDDIENQSVDFIYIDGDHRTEAVLQDLEYIRKIKLGGMLSGHDWRFHSVKKAIDQFVNNKRLVFKCCGTTQFVGIINKKARGSDWWIDVPKENAIFNKKCSFCQNEFKFYIKDIDWL